MGNVIIVKDFSNSKKSLFSKMKVINYKNS